MGPDEIQALIMQLDQMKATLSSMSAQGDEQAMGGMDLGDEGAGDELQSWNSVDVALPPPNKPIFFDKSIVQQAPAAMMPPPQYTAGAEQDPGMVDDDMLPYQPVME